MSNEYQDTLDVINQMAMVKMAMNRHKGKIEDVSSVEIIAMLRGEVDELAKAVASHHGTINVIEEAADVMNFLVALTHQQIEQYRHRKDKILKIEGKVCDCRGLGSPMHTIGEAGCEYEEGASV